MYNFEGDTFSLDNHLFVYFDDNYVMNGFMLNVIDPDAIK